MRQARNAALLVLSLVPVARAEGSEYVLEILDLHEKLATNEVFLQQAKLLGTYMQEAQGMSHDQRVAVYRRVLGILREIERAPAKEAPATAAVAPPAAPLPEKAAGHTPAAILDAGTAHLEWFKAESFDALPDVAQKRALWARDLVCMGEKEDLDLPPAPDAPIARISFFFEAKAPGDHGFSAQHGDSDFRILVGGRQVVDLPRKGGRKGEGTVYLEEGFHRIDVLLRYEKAGDPSFAVSVTLPGAPGSRVVATSDMLLKRAPGPQQ